MRLSRRDALTALAAAGIAATAGCGSQSDGETDVPTEESTPTEGSVEGDGPTATATATPEAVTSMDTLVALAEVLYPSEAEPTSEFVETFMYGRINDEEAYRAELESGVETLNRLANDQHGEDFHALDADQRVSVIENTDLRTGASDEEGSDVERTNYYLLDELLFAFYSSPVGGELVGSTNPRGFPGGFGYSPPLDQ